MLKTTKGFLLSFLLTLPALAVAQSPEEQYDVLIRTNQGLEALNASLERQIQRQEQEIANLEASLLGVPGFEAQVQGLLERMMDGLARFVELDVPFLLEERNDRVAELQALIDDAEIGSAEKFRRVFEAWEVEGGYGRDVSAYAGEQNIEGTDRTVDFLRLGRVGLYYQTPDLQYQAAWDQDAGEWRPLGSDYRNTVRQAIRMASNQVAPDIALLPIRPPVTGEVVREP